MIIHVVSYPITDEIRHERTFHYFACIVKRNIYLESSLNSFTLGAPLEPNVCYFHTFENNLRTEVKFTKYLKESCSLASDKHFSFKCFPENAFVSNIFPNLSGLFWLLRVLMG